MKQSESKAQAGQQGKQVPAETQGAEQKSQVTGAEPTSVEPVPGWSLGN